MTVYTEHFLINTHGFTDIIDITQKVKSAVYQHNLKNGCVIVKLQIESCFVFLER